MAFSMVKRKILTTLEKSDGRKPSASSLSHVCYVSRVKEKLIKNFKGATTKKKKKTNTKRFFSSPAREWKSVREKVRIQWHRK